MTLSDAIERFRTYIATERRLAPGTVRNYIDDLEDFDAWLRSQDIEVLDDVTAREVRSWQMEHMERGEHAGTVK